MQSSILILIIQDMHDQGAFSDINIPKAWAVFMFAMSFLIVHCFPHDDSWAPVDDWIIAPLINIHSKLTHSAFLMAEKVQIFIDTPGLDYDRLQGVLGFLTEFIRWLRRLNFCYSFVVAHLNRINYLGADTAAYNHQECELATDRLSDYCGVIQTLLDNFFSQ